MMDVHILFRDMPIRILITLIILTISLSALTFYELSNKAYLSPQTKIDGFLTFAVIHNGQGNINISNDEILIEATSASQPKVLIYASTSDFKWSFSVVPLSAVGDSHPIAFSLDWKFGEFLVWAHASYGWYYNYRIYNHWISNGTYLGSTITLGSKYDVKIEWKKLSETIALSFLIENSTWQKILTLEIAIPSNIRVDYSNLYIEAWANRDAYALVKFHSNQFVSYNADKFAQRTFFSFWSLFIGSMALSVITIFAFIEKLRHFASSSIQISFHRIRAITLSLNIKELINQIILYVRTNSTCFLMLILFGGVRLTLAIYTSGHPFDIHSIKTWFYVIQSRGLVAIYQFSDILPPYLGARPVYPYPPIIAYILLLLQSFPMDIIDGSLAFMVKLPPIVADLLLGLVVFTTVKNREGPMNALIALFLSLLNMINSSIWGQNDSIVALFMVLSVWLVATKRLELGWFFAALAISTKQTALVFVPGLFVLSVRQRQWSKLFYGFTMFTATIFLIWYPFLLNHFSLDFAMGVLGLRLLSSGGGLDPISPEGGGGTSIWAFNIWPLVTLVLNGQPLSIGIIGAVKDTLPNQFYVMSYFQLGIALFALTYIVVSTRIWKVSSPRDTMLQFSLLMLTFYMLPTRIHERYLIYALSFLPMVYNKSKIIIGSYLALLTTYSLSLIYGLLGGPWRCDLGGFSPLTDLIFSEYGLFILILINILVFLLLMYINFKSHNT